MIPEKTSLSCGSFDSDSYTHRDRRKPKKKVWRREAEDISVSTALLTQQSVKCEKDFVVAMETSIVTIG